MCSATSRLIVEASVAPALLNHACGRAKALRVGSPRADGTEMGPLTTRPQFEKVLAASSTEARAEAPRHCLTGGEVGHIGEGFFVQPSAYVDVPAASFLWREEIFGPVLAVRTLQDRG